MASACGAALSPGPPAVTCAVACGPGAAVGRGAPAAWSPPPPAPAWVRWFRRSRQSLSLARPLFLRGGEEKKVKRHHWGSVCPGCRKHGDVRSMGTTGTLGAWGCREHGEHVDAGSMGMLGTRGCHERGGHRETRSIRMPGAQGTASPQAAPRQGPGASLSSLACLPSSSYFSLSAREQWKG